MLFPKFVAVFAAFAVSGASAGRCKTRSRTTADAQSSTPAWTSDISVSTPSSSTSVQTPSTLVPSDTPSTLSTATSSSDATPSSTATPDSTTTPESTTSVASSSTPEGTTSVASSSTPEGTTSVASTSTPESTTSIESTSVPESTTSIESTTVPESTTTIASTSTSSENPCATVTNLIQNGGFDSPLDGSPWVPTGIQISTTNPKSGTQSALTKIRSIGQRDHIDQTVPLVSGKSYTLRYNWSIVSGSLSNNRGCYIDARVDAFANQDFFPLTSTPLGTYSEHVWNFVAPDSNLLQFIVFCNSQAAGLDVTLDDVSLYENVPSCPIPT